MSKHNIEAIYRLSPVQEGILFHTLESAKPGAYFSQYSCVCEGEFDQRRFAQAWDEVAQRHPPLRTLITWERRDKPLQIVRALIELPWTVNDWRTELPEKQEQAWLSLIGRDRDQGFDLSEAPLMRFTMCRLADDRHRFLFSFHHILFDGWSLLVILNEVSRAYDAMAAGEDSRLPQARPYGEFFGWLEDFDATPAEAFWANALCDFSTPTCPEVSPSERDRSSHGRYASREELSLSAAVSRRLEAFARRERMTLNTLVTAAWALLVSRYTGSDDVVFGTTVAGRPPEFDDAERMVGLFINTLPIRVRMHEGIELKRWLEGIQKQQLDMRQFEQTPLTSIQRLSGVRPGVPLFESIVVFENFPEPMLQGANPTGLQTSRTSYDEYSHYPLALIAFPGDRLELKVLYDNRRYGTVSIMRLLNHLATLLKAFSLDPSGSLDEISMATDADCRRSIETWNETEAEFPDVRCIHELIEMHANNQPDRTAVATDSAALSYHQLNARANRLAHRLMAAGVGLEVPVAIFAERGPEAITAMLGVLKAGGAYVPLDAALPRDRISQILDDLTDTPTENAGSSRLVILTQANLVAELPAGDHDVLLIDQTCAAASDRSDANPPHTATADNLAYVMYTSGSTGRSKGVMVTHRNLVNSTQARPHYYGETLSSYLMLSSIATDSSVAGIFWSLCSGACLALPRPQLEQDLAALAEFTAQRECSHLLCLLTLYDLILEHCDASRFASLKAVIVAGEACSRDVINKHFENLPGVPLYNEYGPTEATVWATVAKLTAEHGHTGAPIGGPIANVSVYVLDAQQRPVPIGLAGELYVGGAGVARGYFNQSDKTAERFLPNPFVNHGGATMYRTGDRVRYRDDGELEYLGCLDNQIKVRGYRIEPEEIETLLVTHPAVQEAVVILEATADDETMPAVEALAARLTRLNVANADGLLSEIKKLSQAELEHALQTAEDIT